jgi:GMP reductase
MISSSTYCDYSNVLIVPKASNVSSRSDVQLDVPIKINNKLNWNGVPIVAANMDSTGTFEIYKVLSKHKMITALHKHYTKEDFLKIKSQGLQLNKEYFMISTGISSPDIAKLEEIMSVIDTKWICVDIANGYLKQLQDVCLYLSNKYPDKILVAGNIATPDMVYPLKMSGVDVIKVGIGPGSACTTRIKTGVGVPQLSAVLNCVKEANKHNVLIMADGGITCPGDVSKAFVAGAGFVMVGGEFAGHDETSGEIIEKNGKQYKEFYGMSSKKAMVKHTGKMNNYRSSEGREILIPYKGPLENTVLDYLGGIRSTCTYLNANNLLELKINNTFIRVNNQFNSHLI